MLKYNLKVNFSEARTKENDYDDKFKFSNIREIYSLDKWIGDVKGLMRDNVSQGNTVFFKIGYDVSYTSKDYHLLKWELMKKIGQKLYKQYNKKYLPDENWFNRIKPEHDRELFFIKDPVFAEKVIIKDENSKIFIVGDVHSSIHSIIDILKELRDTGYFIENTFKFKKDIYFFFLGDLVDRGPYGIEVLCLGLILKDKNPDNVFIINGNHEDEPIYDKYGLNDEIDNQFKDFGNLPNDFIKTLLFYLPSVIYLKLGDKYFHLSHGAILNKELFDSKKTDIKKFLSDNDVKYYLIEEENIGNSLKWGDFKIENGFKIDGYGRPQFGTDKIIEYCQELNISSLITGHQDQENLLIQPNEKSEFYKKWKNIHKKKIGDKFIVVGPNETMFIYCNKLPKICNRVDYDLYSVFEEEKKTFNLDPTQDFHSLVTSTATITRELLYNCYLELTFKNNLGEIIKNCNL